MTGWWIAAYVVCLVGLVVSAYLIGRLDGRRAERQHTERWARLLDRERKLRDAEGQRHVGL